MRLDLITNFVIFQLGWIVAVAGAAQGYPWAGVVYAVIWLTLQCRRMDSARRGTLRLALAAALFGWLADSLLVLSGAIAFPGTARLGWLSPLWMVALWLMFSMTLRHSLGWLRERYLLGAVLGLFAGPLAYWAGEQLGAIRLADGGVGLAAVAAAWTLGMLGLLRLEVATRVRGDAGGARAVMTKEPSQ